MYSLTLENCLNQVSNYRIDNLTIPSAICQENDVNSEINDSSLCFSSSLSTSESVSFAAPSFSDGRNVTYVYKVQQIGHSVCVSSFFISKFVIEQTLSQTIVLFVFFFLVFFHKFCLYYGVANCKWSVFTTTRHYYFVFFKLVLHSVVGCCLFLFHYSLEMKFWEICKTTCK